MRTYVPVPAILRKPFSSAPPLPPLQRLGVAAAAAVTAFIDPARADMVALLGEVTGEPALRRLHSRMLEDADGRYLLENKPRIRTSDMSLDSLREFPAGSFGHAYAAYLDRHGFDPDDRHEVTFVSDPELAYVMQRYREVHDFWHVLSGLPPTVLGETAVKWLEMVQTGLPMAALSSFVAPIRLSPQQRSALFRVYVPWATSVGRNARFLLAVRYEDLLDKPLDEVRVQLRFKPAPQLQ